MMSVISSQVFVWIGRSGFGSVSCSDPRVTGRLQGLTRDPPQVAGRPNCPARGSRVGRPESSKPASFTGSGRVCRIKYLLSYVEARADRSARDQQRAAKNALPRYAATRPPSEAPPEHSYLHPLSASVSESAFKRNIYT